VTLEEFEREVTAFLDENAHIFGVDTSKLSLVRAMEGATKPIHFYYEQRHEGLPVFNAEVAVHMDRNGRVWAVNNTFVPVTVNKLQPIVFEDESLEQYGVADIEQFTWKQLLDGMTCTHCGRCTSVCPANITGKVLDPKKIIIEMNNRTLDKAPYLVADGMVGEYGTTDLEGRARDV